MTQHIMMRDGVNFSDFDVGQGSPVIFQHGLGGDIGQINESFPHLDLRRLTLECRGQGQSEFGNAKQFSISQFADDVLAFADQRGVDKFVMGGISMGAAIALRIAVIAPDRVEALILARPAWNWDISPENMSVFKLLAEYVEKQDKAGFVVTAVADNFAINAPDNYASLLRLFDKTNPKMIAKLHHDIASSGPEVSEQQVRGLAIPTLVMANAIDIIHPIAVAQKLSAAIPNSRFIEIAPKAIDRAKHFAEFHAAVTDFLKDNEVIN